LFDVVSSDGSEYTAWQILHASCGQLMTFPNRPGPAGAIPTPDLATGPRRVTNAGRTYTFTIRGGVRFSPPSSQTVTAATFAHSIERALDPKTITAGPGASLFSDIEGAQAFSAGRARHVSGLVARGQTLQITIRRRDWTLPARLAVPTLCAMPTDVPAVASPGVAGPLPSAGPYMVTDFVPGSRVVLEPNPRYRGPRTHRLARLEVTRTGSDRAVALAEQGRVDYVASGISLDTARRLTARYGPGSPAARAGRQQYFETPQLNTQFLMLNTSRPLFRDVRVRRAANALPAPARYDAYRRLDQDLARAAPAIALENNVRRSFLSARIGCAFDHPVYGIDLTALSCARAESLTAEGRGRFRGPAPLLTWPC
jgi:ABC-type transport system substrate-binding protein